MKVTSVAPSSPFKQAMLSPEECYILDNGVDKTIFVWKGAAKHFLFSSSFCTNSNKGIQQKYNGKAGIYLVTQTKENTFVNPTVQLTIKANLCMTCRSRYFLQVAKRLSLSSSFPTGGIRMRPQVPVRPTLLAA